MISIGLTYTSSTMVTDKNSADAMGSGSMPVLATPAMIALMENAAMMAVADVLPEGCVTVGSAVNVEHIRPTGVGTSVSATAHLVAVDGRKLTFEVVAVDVGGTIGKGTHVRYIVDSAKFMAKIQP